MATLLDSIATNDIDEEVVWDESVSRWNTF
jgi:hypothetical protein